MKNKCPKCGSKTICDIPTSTLPIDDNGFYIGTKIKSSEKTLKRHKSIKHICGKCLYEWG